MFSNTNNKNKNKFILSRGAVVFSGEKINFIAKKWTEILWKSNLMMSTKSQYLMNREKRDGAAYHLTVVPKHVLSKFGMAEDVGSKEDIFERIVQTCSGLDLDDICDLGLGKVG